MRVALGLIVGCVCLAPEASAYASVSDQPAPTAALIPDQPASAAVNVGVNPEPTATPTETPPPANAVLPQGTALKLMLNSELTTTSTKTGDKFDVTVLEDVAQGGTIVIPKGTIGHGEVIFAANKGGFGRAGLLYIALRTLDLGDRPVLLDGRFREEGKDNNGATAATYFAVGVFAGFISGKPGTIPKGRELQARTGEPIEFIMGKSAAPNPLPDNAAASLTPEPKAAGEAASGSGNGEILTPSTPGS